jgi:hypothetical protein
MIAVFQNKTRIQWVRNLIALCTDVWTPGRLDLSEQRPAECPWVYAARDGCVRRENGNHPAWSTRHELRVGERSKQFY